MHEAGETAAADICEISGVGGTLETCATCDTCDTCDTIPIREHSERVEVLSIRERVERGRDACRARFRPAIFKTCVTCETCATCDTCETCDTMLIRERSKRVEFLTIRERVERGCDAPRARFGPSLGEPGENMSRELEKTCFFGSRKVWQAWKVWQIWLIIRLI